MDVELNHYYVAARFIIIFQLSFSLLFFCIFFLLFAIAQHENPLWRFRKGFSSEPILVDCELVPEMRATDD